MTLTWYVDVDWNNDGTYEGEEGTGLSPHLLYDVDVMRGRKIVTRFTDREASGVAYVDVGKATLSFHNTDGRYDPYNASSPLHDNLLPGRMARVRVNDGATTEDVITGRIQNITPLTESNGHEKAIIEIVDGLQLLTLDKCKLVAITISTLIRNIIASLIYPMGYGLISDPPTPTPGIDAAEVSTATLDVWFSGDTPLDAIRKLSEAEKGVFFVDRHGIQTFYSVYLPQSATVTWTDAQTARNGIALPNPWDNYRNKITVKAHNYTVAGLPRTDLWTYGEELFVAATSSVVIRAEYSGAADILDPVETTDYRMFSETGAGGTERTTTFTVTADKYSNYSDITVTAGAHDAYIYLLKIRGKVISDNSATYVSSSTNLSNLTIDNPWVKSYSTALQMQGFMIDFFAGGNGFPMVRMRNKPTYQFARDLFDVVHLESTEKSLDQDYRIGWVHHKWVEPGGQIVDSTFGLEPPLTWYHAT